MAWYLGSKVGRSTSFSSTDLAVSAFLALREAFFDDRARPKTYELRDKAQTQDDPLDEYIAEQVLAGISSVRCEKATGPLVSPDLCLVRGTEGQSMTRAQLLDTSRVLAIEVKKIERAANGKVARPTGMDYNTTPPCGIVRVYDLDRNPIDIRCYYLFICQESAGRRTYKVTGLALVDGSALNEDFEYYLSIVGERQKLINLGTYGDGADRQRPMVIFSNPLGAEELDHHASLVHMIDGLRDRRLKLAHDLRRVTKDGDERIFKCHRLASDVRATHERKVIDGFPTPRRRAATQSRGRFTVPVRSR